MGGVGLSLGLLLGGLLTSYIGWQSTFFVNVPIAVLVLILAPIALKESRTSSRSRHFDVAGSLSVTAGIADCLLSDSISGRWLAEFQNDHPGVIGIVLLILFVIIETRTREPLIPFRLFRLRSLTGAALTATIFPRHSERSTTS